MNRLLHAYFAVVLCGLSIVTAAEVKLTGIVCQNGKKSALLEISMSPGKPLIKPVLLAGERVESVTVTSIDEQAAKVIVRDGEQNLELALEGQAGVANQTFNFKGANSSQVLEVYQEITGRTVLRSPVLVASHIDLKTGAGLSAVDAEAALAGALQEKGTVMSMRFDKFAFAVPFSYVPRLASLKEPPVPPKLDDKGEVFPPGLIKFSEADKLQVLEIYQELSGLTLLQSPDLPGSKITVRSQTELSGSEAMWILETLLRLGGITLVPDGKLVFVLRTTRDNGLPPISSNAVLGAGGKEPLPPELIKFTDATGAQVLQVYAKLIGREAVSKNVPACRFTLRSQTPMTSGEAIYALDAAAALNQVRFVVTDKQVSLMPVVRTESETK